MREDCDYCEEPEGLCDEYCYCEDCVDELCDPDHPWVGGADEQPTFEDTFEVIYKEAFDLLVSRQRKYGPENIKQLGLFGVFDRMASDKIERVRRAFNGTIKNGHVTLEDQTDFGDESFDDALLDIANYALIMLALKRGQWGAPLRPVE